MAIAKYRFNDRELKELLSTIVVLIDTREQKNKHITDYFDKQNIIYKSLKQDYGDYSVMLPKNEVLGILRDMFFPVSIERKNSINELAGTIKERTRFENELIRSQKSEFVLLVEDQNGYEKIIKGDYRSEYNPKAMLASLKAFETRYNFNTVFINRIAAGNFIYHHFYYYVREFLKS